MPHSFSLKIENRQNSFFEFSLQFFLPISIRYGRLIGKIQEKRFDNQKTILPDLYDTKYLSNPDLNPGITSLCIQDKFHL